MGWFGSIFGQGDAAIAAASRPASFPLHFKDGRAALEYACRNLDCALHVDGCLPAIIEDTRQLFGAAEAVKREPDGHQVALLRVASSDEGFLVMASTAGTAGPALQPGQFVLWRPMHHSPTMAARGGNERFGWIGLIVGTLRPEYRNGAWVGGEWFR